MKCSLISHNLFFVFKGGGLSGELNKWIFRSLRVSDSDFHLVVIQNLVPCLVRLTSSAQPAALQRSRQHSFIQLLVPRGSLVHFCQFCKMTHVTKGRFSCGTDPLTRSVEIMQRQRFKFYHYELSTPAIYMVFHNVQFRKFAKSLDKPQFWNGPK